MDIIERAGMVDSKPCTILIDTSSKLSRELVILQAIPLIIVVWPEHCSTLTFTHMNILPSHDCLEAHSTLPQDTLDFGLHRSSFIHV
jgi:hypothetical protein